MDQENNLQSNYLVKRLKLVADSNLGRLAKWLRILGYDVAFYKDVSIITVSRIANSENRIFLTRNQKIANRRIFDYVRLIKSDHIFDQLQELLDLITDDDDFLFTRCSVCNKLLSDIEKQKLESLVPTYIYQANEQFKICQACGKIYWSGTHYEEMKKKLKEVFRT